MSPASTLNNFSTNTSYSNESRKNNSNPFNDLVKSEQLYVDTLKMIDCQVAPIWMKQMTTASPDFSELLMHAHEILQANKRFRMKMMKIANDSSKQEEAFIQWVNDLDIPYTNYSRAFIPNINDRYDIVENPAIHSLIKDLSSKVSCEINLESLFYAPMKQLKYYKGILNSLLEGKPNHAIFIEADRKLDSILMLAQNHDDKPKIRPVVSFAPPPLPSIQTNFETLQISSELMEFERQVDCSRTADLFTDADMDYQLRVANPGAQLIMRDSFIMISNDNFVSTQVHFLLTTQVLVMCRELSLSHFLLMYPAVPIHDITVKAESVDREMMGEYILCFTILGKKHIRVHADSKKTRNTWVGVDQDAPSSVTVAPQMLSRIMQRNRQSLVSSYQKSSVLADKRLSVQATDFLSYYSESEGVSPLESSEDEERPKDDMKNSQEDIMDFYDTPSEPEVTPPPLSKSQPVKFIPHVPIVARALLEPIHPPTPKKDKHNVIPSMPRNQVSKMSVSTTFSPHMNRNSPVSSPKYIEVQKAVIPEVMQAVTQKTDDYLNYSPRRPPMQLPRSSSQQQQMYGQPSGMRPQQQSRSQSSWGYNHRPPMPSSNMKSAPGSPQIQQERYNPNGHSSHGTVSPPQSPGDEIKTILFSNSQCDVFHWANQSWYAAEGDCLVQIQLSYNHRTCVAVQLQNTGQLYLAAWVVPSMLIRQAAPTDVNMTLFMSGRKENYLMHFAHAQDAHVFTELLQRAHQEQQHVEDRPEPVDPTHVPQTLTPIMQCKAKLFIQNETNSWSTFGTVKFTIAQQSPSKRMMVQMENDKSKLVSAIVKSGNVERMASKRITFLLADETAKTSIVYMIHLREDETGNKIYDYLRTKNADNGF